MSLIEDALRKQQREAASAGQSAKGETPPAAPSDAKSPPPLPATASEPAVEKRSRGPLLAAIAIAVALIVVGGGVGLWLKFVKAKPAIPDVRAILGRRAAATTSPATPAAASNAAAVSMPGAEAMGESQRVAEATATGETVSATAPAEPPATSAATETSSNVATQPPTHRVETPSPPPETKVPVVWPKLRLAGVLSAVDRGQESALINDQIVTRGQVIEGVSIVSISRSGVQVEYQGETRILRAGETTE